MKKNTIGYILMGLYVVVLVIGLVFRLSVLTNIGTALAVFSFLYIQQPGKKGVVDEREKFIINKAGSMSFIVLLTALVFGSVFNDLIEFTQYVTLEDLFQIMIGLGFMTFVSMYIFYTERHE
jgi:hypothetical protein